MRQTLGLSKGTAVYATERVVVGRPRDKAPAEKRKRKEGHDALIEILAKKARAKIVLLNGKQIEGDLKESDRFTITIIQSVLEDMKEIQVQRIVFKHAIESFTLDVGTNVRA